MIIEKSYARLINLETHNPKFKFENIRIETKVISSEFTPKNEEDIKKRGEKLASIAKEQVNEELKKIIAELTQEVKNNVA